MSLVIVSTLVHKVFRRWRLMSAAATLGVSLFILGSCALAVSRVAALLLNYRAPMTLYLNLPEVRGGAVEYRGCEFRHVTRHKVFA